MVVDKKTRKVICTAFANGKRHDFRLFRESKTHIHPGAAKTDTGYVGIKKIHAPSVLPKKKTKKKPLTAAEKAFNREISKKRVSNEHAIGFIKRFKILAGRDRNHRKLFRLRCSLIAGICHFEMSLSFRKRSIVGGLWLPIGVLLRFRLLPFPLLFLGRSIGLSITSASIISISSSSSNAFFSGPCESPALYSARPLPIPLYHALRFRLRRNEILTPPPIFQRKQQLFYS